MTPNNKEQPEQDGGIVDKALVGGMTRLINEQSVTIASLRAEVGELVEALVGLAQAVEKDSKENNSMSGYTGARLADAKEVLAKHKSERKGGG